MKSENGTRSKNLFTVGPRASSQSPLLERTASNRELAVRGTIWSIVGYAGQQGLRLASNLILTRLLFPEAFGLIAIVLVVVQGTELLTDVGTQGSVIRHRRGDVPEFVNTAWTLQAIRGTAIWLLICLLSWPMSVFYAQPILLYLIPVVGLRSMIGGMSSTAVLLLRRYADIRPLVIQDVISQVLALLVIVSLALQWKSVWVLVVGILVQVSLSSALSYLYLPAANPKFCWDVQAVRDIVRYGRWILLSTAGTFFLQQGDKIILAKLMPPEELGVYVIGALLATVLLEAISRIHAQVLFPLYSRVYRESPQELREVVFKARSLSLALALPLMWIMAVFGTLLVEFLFDSRYHGAGWVLEILAAGLTFSVIGNTAAMGSLLAVGDSLRMMVLQLSRALFLFLGLFVGYKYSGTSGAIIGISVSRLLDYPMLIWALKKHNLWLPGLDASAYGCSALIIFLGWWLF